MQGGILVEWRVEQQGITMTVLRHEAHARRSLHAPRSGLVPAGKEAQQFMLPRAFHGRDAHDLPRVHCHRRVAHPHDAALVAPGGVVERQDHRRMRGGAFC